MRAIQGQKQRESFCPWTRSKNFLSLPNLRKEQEKRLKKQGQKRGKVKIIFVLDNMPKSFQDRKDKNSLPTGGGRLFDLAAAPPLERTRKRKEPGGLNPPRPRRQTTLCARTTAEGAAT